MPYKIWKAFFFPSEKFGHCFVSSLFGFVTTFHRKPKRVFKCVSILNVAATMCVIKCLSSGSSYQNDRKYSFWVRRNESGSVLDLFLVAMCEMTYICKHSHKFSTFQAFCTWNSFSHLPELKWTSVSRCLRSVKLIYWNRQCTRANMSMK